MVQVYYKGETNMEYVKLNNGVKMPILGYGGLYRFSVDSSAFQ